MTNDFGPLFKGRAAYHQRNVPKQLLSGGKVCSHLLLLLHEKRRSDWIFAERPDKDATCIPGQAHAAGRRVRAVTRVQLRFCPSHDQHLQYVHHGVSYVLECEC